MFCQHSTYIKLNFSYYLYTFSKINYKYNLMKKNSLIVLQIRGWMGRGEWARIKNMFILFHLDNLILINSIVRRFIWEETEYHDL